MTSMMYQQSQLSKKLNPRLYSEIVPNPIPNLPFYKYINYFHINYIDPRTGELRNGPELRYYT